MGMNNPTGDQFRDLKESCKTGMFVMINLLKFSAQGMLEGESGVKAYERYARAVTPLLRKVGARLLWLGSVDQVFIGKATEGYDHVMLVEYPSRKAFLEMVSSQEYLVANQDREAGLEKTVLMVADPIYSVLDKTFHMG